MKRLLATVALVVAASSASMGVLPAAALAPQDAVVTCDLNELLQQLAQIRQDGSSTTVAAELELRKRILARSMECNAREAGVLAGGVKEVEGMTRVAKTLKTRYTGQLAQANAFASAQASATAAVQSVEASKDMARDLKAWRAETYNPLAWEASQLIVIDRNLGLASSGEDRVEQLQQALADLDEAPGTDAVRDDLTRAETLISDADIKLSNALVLLRDAPDASQEAITNAQKTGLDELSQAYRLLLDANAKMGAIPAPAQ